MAAVAKQGVDDRVAGDQYVPPAHSFAQQSGASRGSGGVVDLGQTVGQAPVDLLGIGAVDVVGPQAGFHVRHGDHAVVGGKSGGEGGGGVAVDHDQIGLGSFQEGVDAVQHGGGDVAERLPVAHDPEVMVDREGEVVDHLVEHLAVLSGEAGDDPEVRRAAVAPALQEPS